MKRQCVFISLLALLTAVASRGAMSQTAIPNSFGDVAKKAAAKNAIANYGHLPLSFEENRGQASPEVKFLSRGPQHSVFLTPTQATVVIKQLQKGAEKGPRQAHNSAIRIKLSGAKANAGITGLDELPGKSNYFLGNDPAKWHTNVPTFGKVFYRNIYPGIDLVYYGNQRELEFDFVVATGADPRKIRLNIDGARVSIDGSGSALLHGDAGEIRLIRPHVFQQIGGRSLDVPARYVRRGHELRFAVADYDHRGILTIDPQLVYSTYLGGSSGDNATGIAVNSSGNAYVVGTTSSLDFPTVNPIQAFTDGNTHAFVAKLNAAGSALVYSTYLGGAGGSDSGNSIAVDASGNAYVTGSTNSTDFPAIQAAQSANAGGSDAFVTKLNADGSALIYSTYLGGSAADQGNSIAVDSFGSAYVAGRTCSTDFPVASPFQSSLRSVSSFHGCNAFVAKLNPADSALSYSTYLGGSYDDTATGIATDSSGNAYVTGYSKSGDFPLASAIQPVHAGDGLHGSTIFKLTYDAFVTKLNPAGNALTYSTYLGGSDDDFGAGIAVDSSGNAYVTGYTQSSDFPLSSPLQAINAGGNAAFVTKINAAGSAWVYSTYLGGTSGSDFGSGIAVDLAGNAFVTGSTRSTDFPGINSTSIEPTNGGASDAFIVEVNASGSALSYSTYLGGGDNDGGTGIVVDPTGNVYVTGTTSSVNFPISSPFQAIQHGAFGNGFVAKLSLASATGLPTTTTLVSSVNPSALGQSVTFTATVTASSGSPGGSVTFFDGATNLGNMNLINGQASLIISNLALSSHSIYAIYSGDPTFATSMSIPPVLQNVRQFASNTILVSSSQLPNAGQAVTLTATVTGVGTNTVPSGNVAFEDGQATLGTAALSKSGVSVFTATSLAIGRHSITAVYQGDSNFGSSSSASTAITVNATPPIYTTSSIPVGTGPIAEAINPVTHTLFVANQGSNNVTAIDTRTNTVLALIPAGKAPTGIAVNTKTNQIYVANRDSGDVTVIDGVTYTTSSIAVGLPDLLNPPSLLPITPVSVTVNEVSGEVYVGASTCAFAVITGNTVDHPGSFLCGPVAIAVSPLSQRAYVAESQDSDVEGYEALTDVHLTDFSIGPGPLGTGAITPVALAIDAPLVYVGDASPNGSVEYFDETQPNSKSRDALGSPVYAIAVNHVDGEVYAAIPSPSAGQAASVVAIFGNVTLPVGQTPVAAQVPVPAPNKIGIDSSNDLVLVANELSNDVTVIDGFNLNVLSAVPVGNFPTAVLVNPGQCDAYVTNFASNSVTVLNPSINGPGVCLSTNLLTFPAQLVGTTSDPQTVTLTNIGTSDLIVSSVVTDPSVFVESNDCHADTFTKLIAPGSACTLQVKFGPAVGGVITGQITINDNSSGSPHFVALSGLATVPASVALTVDANPAVFGEEIMLTAKITGPPGSPTPTGRVQFFDGGNLLTTNKLAADGSTSTFVTLSSIASRTFTANYLGDLFYIPGSSTALVEMVNQAATQVKVTSSSINSDAGENVAFTATVMVLAPGGTAGIEPAGTLTFFDGPAALSPPQVIQNGGATFRTTSLLAGSHSITATYAGDMNLIGSTSSAITQVVNAQSGGGGGGGGNGGGCACSKLGTYQAPVDPISALPSDPNVPGPLVSPNQKYTVKPTPHGSGISQIDVFPATSPNTDVLTATSSGNDVLTWGFSPDDDRIVTFTKAGEPGQEIVTFTVYDLTVRPHARMVVNAAGHAGEGGSMSFSPSGRYVLVNFAQSTSPGPGLLPAFDLSLYLVQGVAAQMLLYDSGDILYQLGRGPDVTQTEVHGFSPDNPETSFVYVYIDNNGLVQWNLVGLTQFSKNPLKKIQLPNLSADFWAYSPCGDVIGLVTQTSAFGDSDVKVNITLMNTANGAAFAPVSGTPVDEGSSQLILLCTGSQQQYEVVGLQPTSYNPLLTNSSCANTPTGNNLTVIPSPPTPGPAPVSVTFGQVTSPGTTTLASVNAPQPPPNFKTTNPQISFDLTTTAKFAVPPGATVCVSYSNLNPTPTNLSLMHLENGQWVDRTVSIDTVHQIICANPSVTNKQGVPGVSSFSPFAVFEPVSVVTITANDVSRLYGAPDPTPFQVSYNGFVNGDTSATLSGQLLCTSSDTASSPVGSYTIDCSSSTLSSPNYVITYQPGNLTVTPAPLTLSADNQHKTYGAPAPNLTFGASGFVNGDTAASLTTQPTLSATVTAATGVGNYPITIGGAVDPNYSISYAQGTFVVNPATLTITADNKSRQYGQADPQFTVSYSGFMNGDTQSVLLGTLSCSSRTMPSSTVSGSPYAINCSGLNSANYTVGFVPGQLTISPAALTITANSASKLLNAVNPSLTSVASGFVNGENSGVFIANATCITTATTNSPVGKYPITCAGASAANYAISYVAGTLSVMYSSSIGHVIQPPISDDGSSVFNQGRTIPAKFSVYDANGLSIGTAGVVSSFYLTAIRTGTVTDVVQDVVDTNNPDAAFRWDPTAQQWIFNISTGNLTASSTYVYTIILNDGSVISFRYGLR